VVAGIFIVIYPIGIVAIFVALLYLNRKVLGDHAVAAEQTNKIVAVGRSRNIQLPGGWLPPRDILVRDRRFSQVGKPAEI
jgi:hypothetical protein